MPRIHYMTYVTDEFGAPVTGAQITVLPRYTSTPCAIYQFASGTIRLATPLLTQGGKTEFWLDDITSYNITTSGTTFQNNTHYFDAISADRVAALSSGQPIAFVAATPPSVANNSLFRDTVDNKLKFKDNSGVVNLLY